MERIRLILLMVQKSGDHQLRLVVYPIIYRIFFYIEGSCMIFFHQHYVLSLKDCMSHRAEFSSSECFSFRMCPIVVGLEDIHL